ncbi:peroxidase-like, partial [Acyrthosiphon pisum]|uniref:Peroxidase n=1 Tax=Acyrthosiphon pisum TaxID=7029 RepID=A0A8R2NXH0_ACYPI
MEVEIPEDDHFFVLPLTRRSCMNYVRSVAAMRSDCTFGPREQMNQATHYLDGSMIYGSTEKKMQSLRTKSNGQLLTNINCKRRGEPQYMQREDDQNACQYGIGTCYKAGDVRANGFPQLTVLHTLWMREHNRLAKQLSYINPHWGDERIFQEARKIVIASIQHITYAEWLPALLGENYTRQNGLELLTEGYSNAYNETVDPAVSNSFATAILPFSNSMISDKLNLYPESRIIENNNAELSLNNHFNQPNHVMVHFLDQLVRGLATQNTLEVDMGFSSEIINYLYKFRPEIRGYYYYGMDVLSLDIQRNRDHGIPSYQQFRKYCGLKDIRNKQDMLEILNPEVLKMYRAWNDIELIVGALFEKHEDDAMVGPTMRCIIREQFIRTRIADRYFYDLPKVFNEYQLAEIRKVTLARVFCDNSDNITTMQKNVFLKPTTPDLQLCNSHS